MQTRDTKEYVPARPARAERVSVRGLDYQVHQWGAPSAPPVVYLHGWGDTGSTLQMVADGFDDRWRLVAPDWRGFGSSRWSGSSYWFPDYLADLDALLDLISPAEPALLIGHSMGGNAAGLFAGIRPERVRGFVNIEGFGLRDSDSDGAPERYRHWLEGLRREQAYRAYADFGELAARILKRSPRMRPEHADFVAGEWARKGPGRSVHLRADPRHRLPNPVQYRRAEALACWRRIEANVAVVVGADSPFAAEAKRWAADAAGAAEIPIHTIAGAGHMPHFEAPELLAKTLLEILERWRA